MSVKSPSTAETKVTFPRRLLANVLVALGMLAFFAHWSGDKATDIQSCNAQYQITISIITYNRLTALQRLVYSLLHAHYGRCNVDVVVHVEAGAPDDLVQYVHDFKWPFGRKQVRMRVSPSGLIPAVVESWYPAFGQEAALLLEDDIEVSPYYFAWLLSTMHQIKNSNMSPRIYGISLYTPRIIETTKPYRRYFADLALPKHSYAYLHQIPCSWGALYFPEHWALFHRYMHHRLSHNSSYYYVPGSRTNSWTSSWKKFFIELAWAKGWVMLYPNFHNQTSFSTNHLEKGVHVSSQGLQHLPVDYTVPLHSGNMPIHNHVAVSNLPVLDVTNNEIITDSRKGLVSRPLTLSCLDMNGYTGMPTTEGLAPAAPVGNKILSGYALTYPFMLVSTPRKSGPFAGYYFTGFMSEEGAFKVTMHQPTGHFYKVCLILQGDTWNSSWEYSLQLDLYGIVSIVPSLCASGNLAAASCQPAWQSPKLSEKQQTFSLYLADDGELLLVSGCACNLFNVVWSFTFNRNQSARRLPVCTGRGRHSLAPNEILSSSGLNTLVSDPDEEENFFEGIMQVDGNFVVYHRLQGSGRSVPVHVISTSVASSQFCVFKMRIKLNGRLQILCQPPGSRTEVLWDNHVEGNKQVPHILQLNPGGFIEIFQGYSTCDKGLRIWSSADILPQSFEHECVRYDEDKHLSHCNWCSPDVFSFFDEVETFTVILYIRGAESIDVNNFVQEATQLAEVSCVLVVWKTPTPYEYVDSFVNGKLVKYYSGHTESAMNMFFPSQHLTTSGVLVLVDAPRNIFRVHDMPLLFHTWLQMKDKLVAFTPAKGVLFSGQFPSYVHPHLLILHKNYLRQYACGSRKKKDSCSDNIVCEVSSMVTFITDLKDESPLGTPPMPPGGFYGDAVSTTCLMKTTEVGCML